MAICDDAPQALDTAEGMARDWANLRGQALDIDRFSSAPDFFADYENGRYDILLLDIEMGAVNGVELAKRVRRGDPDVQIIFLTGYTDYTYDAYYADHIWYVLKTEIEKYLPAALKKAIAGASGAPSEPCLILQQQRTQRRLPLKNVLYLERVTYRTRVKTAAEELYVRAAPMELIHHLPSDSFIRCHQSFWVNAEKISALIGKSFLLVDGSKVPISRTYRQSAIEEFRSTHFEASSAR